MSEQVFFQAVAFGEQFVALVTFVPFVPSVGQIVKIETTPTCKCLGAQVTRPYINHTKLLPMQTMTG